MKKLLTILVSAIFFTVSANADIRLGISGAYTMFSSEGTETIKSAQTKTSKTHEDEVIVPSLFFEIASDDGFGIGVDFIPSAAELGSGTNSRTDTDTDDASDTAGKNKISAELTGHTTIYATVPLGDGGFYLKPGFARATIETKETLATGSKYGDEDVFGLLLGVGMNRDLDNGLFARFEATYTNYEDKTFTGTADADGVRNVIDAEVDALALRVSVGKSF